MRNKHIESVIKEEEFFRESIEEFELLNYYTKDTRKEDY